MATRSTDPPLAPPGSATIETADGSFVTSDGLTLSTLRFHVPKSEHSPVILIHGLADHSRSLPYQRLSRILAAAGFEVFLFDRRGSGRSAGHQGHAERWEDLFDDLNRFVDIVEDQCGRLPALVGMSFGGLQAIDFALRAPQSLRSCVALAPALDVSATSPWLRRVLPILATLHPTMRLDPGLDDAVLTRDQTLCGEYRNDPLWHTHTTPAFAVAALGAIDRVRRRAAQIQTPLLVIHGTADRIVPIQGTREVFPRVGSEDKTFLEIPGAFHCLPLEPEGEMVAQTIGDWLKMRSPTAMARASYPPDSC